MKTNHPEPGAQILGPQLGSNIASRHSNFEPRWFQDLQLEPKWTQTLRLRAKTAPSWTQILRLGARMAPRPLNLEPKMAQDLQI
eukprot:182465-Karenia_brevis.AAC.1